MRRILLTTALLAGFAAPALAQQGLKLSFNPTRTREYLSDPDPTRTRFHHIVSGSDFWIT